MFLILSLIFSKQRSFVDIRLHYCLCTFVRVSNSPTDIRNIIYIINLPLPYALPTLAAKKSLTDL